MDKISEITRRDIVDIIKNGFSVELDEEEYDSSSGEYITERTVIMPYSGRLDTLGFLSRLYDLKELPSHDSRCRTAYDDISCHLRWGDYEEECWFFEDERFNLRPGDGDGTLLRFMCEMLHPAVRNEKDPWKQYLQKFNSLLRVDGYELYPTQHISGRDVYGAREYVEPDRPLLPENLFSERYKDLIDYGHGQPVDHISNHVDYKAKKHICSVMTDFAEPILYRPNRYDNWTEKTDALNVAVNRLNEFMDIPVIDLRGAMFSPCPVSELLAKEYRKMLDKQFKNDNSNFKIAVVVDMWITGFDVPSLAVMYIDKPLQKHTLIQTISRVNRVFDGKDKGLVVDYIGIKNDMMEAIKKYGGPQESPVDELDITIGIFRNHLKMIDDLLLGFNASKFFTGEPLERLNCLNSAAEYVQSRKDTETRFMGLSRRLKSAYNICFPSGELTDEETAKAQFYLAIRSIIYKQTKGNAPDAEAMNQVVENMVREAIACTGIENVVDEHKSVDLFSDEFIEQLNTVKLPITKFNALLKLLRKAISAYGRTNKVKAMEFDERLRKVVDDYNSRDKLVFTNEVVSDFVNDLSDQLLQILRDLQEDQSSFQKMGISFEEKAFYDILVKVRDDHGFPYADEKCVVLAKKIKELVDDKAQFADWSTRDDIKNQLNMELTVLLYQNGYPPEWDEEVFEKVMEQAENFKKYAD